MCDYSLHSVSSRRARVGDRLVTTELAKSSTRGFAAVGEHGAKLVIHDGPPKVAVCLLPGTELAFDNNVRYDRAVRFLGKARAKHKVARFRQIDLDDPHVQHDALEFPDGQVVKVGRLAAGQTATVLQLPVATRHAEHIEIRHVASPDSRIALNRVSSRSGVASILMPNQAAVTLWEACRSTAMGVSVALARSLRRLTALRQHAAVPAAEEIEASFKTDGLATQLPKQPAGRKPDNKIEVKAAA